MRGRKRKYLTIFVVLMILLTLYGSPLLVYAWQYGLSMEPTTTEYDSVEMPTKGMYWTKTPNDVVVFFFVSSTTTDNVFVQNGYVYNGLNTYLSISGGTTAIPPHSWGMFWTYHNSNGYVGDGVLPLPGWEASQDIYFSIAVYTSSGTLSFMFTNSNLGEYIGRKISGVAYGRFSGRVGGIAESSETSGFGNIYVDHVALWAQVLSTDKRNSGVTYVYDSHSPSSVLIHIYVANDVQLGFNTGTHYSDGTTLWSITFSAGNEYVPPDP